MTQLTEHFNYDEKWVRCPCCNRIKIIPIFFLHMELLEKLRVKFGKPITITSGYRCPEHNKEVGGAPNSWHLLFATDITPTFIVADGDLRILYDMAQEVGFTGIGRYTDKNIIHLDMRPVPAQWVA